MHPNTSPQSKSLPPQWVCPGLLFLLLSATFAGAQEESPDKEKPAPAATTSEEIVVVGDRLEETVPLELDKYGARVEVIDRDAIQSGGYVDVTQILQTSVPGLYVAPKNGPFDYVTASLQGSRTKDVLWLVDGVRISNRLYDTTTPLDTLPSQQIERIEVLKGGQSLFYGTQSVGGVVNVVTRGYSTEADGSLGLGLDTNDGTHLDAQARGSKGAHHFVGYASRDDADGFQPFRDEDYQPSATDRERGYDVLTLGGRYRVALGDEALFSAQLQHTDAKLDFAAAEDRAESFNERDEDIASLKLDWSPSSRFDLYVKGYWHDWDSTFTRRDNDLANPGALITIDDDAIWQFSDTGFNLAGELDLNGSATLLFGYDFQSYEGRDDVFLIGSQTESVDALFAQGRFSFDVLAGANLALGARHNEPSDGQSKTVWNVSGELALSDQLYARAQVGTSFRLPSAYELYVIDPCCEKGNPDLVGEESQNAEIGLGGRSQRFYWEATVFDRNVEDLISIDFDLPSYPDGLIVNTDDEVDVFGYELIGGATLTDSLSASFSYMRTEAEEKGSSQQIQDVPEEVARLTLAWHPDGQPLSLQLSGRHVGNIFDSVSGGIGLVEHGNYEVFDLAGSYTFAGRHRLGLRLENAFDEEYDTRLTRVRRDVDGSSYAAGNLGAPRTFYAHYTVTF